MRNRNKVLLLLLLVLAAAVTLVLILIESSTKPEFDEQIAHVDNEADALEAGKVYSTDIVDVFKHCIDVQLKDGGYYPVRFSEERLKDYEGYPVMPYAGCTAGITMEFRTDAPTISFDYKIFKNIWGSGFDIYENGELKESIDASRVMMGTVEYERRSSEASDIVICLPVASNTIIRNPQFGDFQTDVTGDKPKIIVFGDSISQGLFGSTPSKNWIFLLSQKKGYDYLNLSVGGETFRRSALDSDIPFHPDHILVALGTNDLFYTRYLNVIRQNADDYFSTLQRIYPGVPVTVITPIIQRGLSSSSNMFNSTRYYQLTEILSELASNYGYDVIDGSELVPSSVEYFAENDSVHLSSLGFETVAKNLEERINIS